ncbi:MAG: EAL domain-containing protein [Schlesneria sp.]
MTKNAFHFPEVKFAFQPIINAVNGTIIAFEALVRGPNNESPGTVLSQVSTQDLFAFDEHLRVMAISAAAGLNLKCALNIDLLPQSIETSEAPLKSTIDAAKQFQIDPRQLTIEISETQFIGNISNCVENLNLFRGLGIRFAIDDFGCGYSGLNLLADFQPEIIKLHSALIRDVNSRGPRQAIVRGILRTSRDLGIDVIAGGVENLDEYQWCFEEGIELFQGPLFAKPEFERFPSAYYPHVGDDDK